MKTLLAVLVGALAAIGAAVLALMFLRKKQDSWGPAVSSARDTATSWGKSAADGASQAADKVAATAEGATDAGHAASTVADQVKSKVHKGTLTVPLLISPVWSVCS